MRQSNCLLFNTGVNIFSLPNSLEIFDNAIRHLTNSEGELEERTSPHWRVYAFEGLVWVGWVSVLTARGLDNGWRNRGAILTALGALFAGASLWRRR